MQFLSVIFTCFAQFSSHITKMVTIESQKPGLSDCKMVR